MNKNKIIGMILITSMIFNIGCTNNINSDQKESLKSKEVVFEENVINDLNSSVKITQEEINFILPDSKYFNFRFYNNDKLYGEIVSSDEYGLPYESSESIPYYKIDNTKLYVVNNDFTVEETNKEILVYNENEGIRGINSNCYGENQHGVNYYNYETNEFKELYRKKYSSEIRVINYLNGVSNVSEKIVEGNDNFGYSIYNYKENDEKIVSLQVVNLKSGDVYEYEAKGTDINFVIDIVYDIVTEKFYAVNSDGSICEVELSNKSIKFSEIVKLDLDGINIVSEDQVTVNNDGEIILINKLQSSLYVTTNGEEVYEEIEKSNNLVISYKPANKSIKNIIQSGNKNFEIVGYWVESNICILSNGKKEYYIGEIKGDRIDIYHKIEMEIGENDNIYLFNKIINENNTELLLHFKLNEAQVVSEGENVSLIQQENLRNHYIKINIER